VLTHASIVCEGMLASVNSVKILLLNKFFFRLSIHGLRYSPTKVWDGAQMATFWRSFASCISSELRAARFRPAFKIYTKTTPCVEVMVDIQSPTAEIRRGKKKKKEERRKKKEETTG